MDKETIRKKREYIFKVNKLFLYIVLNLIHLFQLLHLYRY